MRGIENSAWKVVRKEGFQEQILVKDSAMLSVRFETLEMMIASDYEIIDEITSFRA